MENDFMMIVSALEKDKGIDRHVLIEGIRSAIEVVAKKTLELPEEKEITVIVNEHTGKITVVVDGKEIRTDKLGRIAAQTAKQVIIQKMREAETDVVYDAFKDKIGELVNGVIQRFDHGNIILEVGRAEAILPREEQVFRDDYRLLDRLRAYVIDIQKTKSHLKLIVSRSHPEMVRKLFQFEVPEISEGNVEIKSIVREAGDRTKIAVHTQLSNIDCVGACVGMRGARVKSIVNELRGEKIDIVRWDQDPEIFIKNALNPAEILRMVLNHAEKKATVTVAKDKLSLVIGRKGQNARLAAKLTGWDIDIKGDESGSGVASVEKLFKDEMDDAEIAQRALKAAEHLMAVEGVNSEMAEKLVSSGFTTVEQLAEADSKDIADMTGLSEDEAERIIAAASNQMGE